MQGLLYIKYYQYSASTLHPALSARWIIWIMQVTDASYYDRGLLSTHRMRKSACFIGHPMLALQEWVRLLLRIDEYIRYTIPMIRTKAMAFGRDRFCSWSFGIDFSDPTLILYSIQLLLILWLLCCLRNLSSIRTHPYGFGIIHDFMPIIAKSLALRAFFCVGFLPCSSYISVHNGFIKFADRPTL